MNEDDRCLVPDEVTETKAAAAFQQGADAVALSSVCTDPANESSQEEQSKPDGRLREFLNG